MKTLDVTVKFFKGNNWLGENTITTVRNGCVEELCYIDFDVVDTFEDWETVDFDKIVLSADAETYLNDCTSFERIVYNVKLENVADEIDDFSHCILRSNEMIESAVRKISENYDLEINW